MARGYTAPRRPGARSSPPTRETPRKSWLSPQPSRGSRVGLTCKQAHPSIETTDLAAARTFRLDRYPVDGPSTVPGPKTRTRNPERRRVVVPSAVLSNRIEHLPCRSEPRPGPILPLMRPAFPWPHLPRGRVESFGATPKGDAFPSPSGAACPDPRTAATGFRPRFPGSVSRVTDRASSLGNKVNVPHRMGREFGFDWRVFARCDYFSRPVGDRRRPTPAELRTRETPRKIGPKPSPSRGSHPPGRKISSANLPDRKPRWPQPVPCGFDCSRSGVASISVRGNLLPSIRVRQIPGLVSFRAPRRVFAGAESHFCHSISV